MGLSAFFQKLLPRDKKFFPMFESHAGLIVEASRQLALIFEEKDYDKQVEIAVKVKELETTGDEIAHKIFDELDKTFITPFDREDIHQLVSALDDVLDYFNGVSQRIKLYRPGKFPPQFREFSLLLVHGSEEIEKAVRELKNLKKPEKITNACIRINELENLGDDLYHMIISDLFQNETNAIELIKVKEVLQTLERACDRIEDVADVLKTIIIKVA
jgi:predicted phosphate transport protein (TIGR00153 family)